jgi:hypothetical protein
VKDLRQVIRRRPGIRKNKVFFIIDVFFGLTPCPHLPGERGEIRTHHYLLQLRIRFKTKIFKMMEQQLSPLKLRIIAASGLFFLSPFIAEFL